MYKILGSDQKEYGPVSAEVLKQWIAEHRVIAQTLLLAEGSTEWKPLSSFPEFNQAGTPPPRPPGLISQEQPQATARPQYTPQWAPTMPSPAKTSGLAIASLVLGLLGFFSCGLTGLFGIVIGIIAGIQIGKSEGRLTGKGMAIAGICTGGASLLLGVLILLASIVPAIHEAGAKAQRIKCVNNLKQLNLAIRLYANDNKDRMPLANNWCDAIQNEVSGASKVFRCPAGAINQACGYAYNSKLSGKRDGEADPRTVMLFETEGGWNVSGGPELMLKKPRHGGYNVGFADGSVRQVPSSELSRLRWDP